MPARILSTRILLTAALLLSLVLPLTAQAEAPSKLTGTLTNESGIPVLRLTGSPKQQGYTHGYLLGPEISTLMRKLLVSPVVWGDVQKYEQGVRKQVIPLFTFSDDERAELEGVLAGMRDRVGEEGMHLDNVNRDIDLLDVIAVNAYADLQNGACTSFAAWGDATVDGGTIVGRNLDFPRLPGVPESQLIIVHADAPAGGKAWLTIGWPGTIGAYTAMNDDAVFVSMHDVWAKIDYSKAPFVPRSIAIRRIMEKVGATKTAEAAVDILRKTQAYCGNNFLVAAPFKNQPEPAVVLEYDADTSVNSGVTKRTEAWKDHRLPAHTIACTNHYRERSQSTQCNRYAKVRRVLINNADQKITPNVAQESQKAAAVDDTLHTVIAQLNERRFTVSFCTETKNATATDPVTFKLDNLFDKAVAKAN